MASPGASCRLTGRKATGNAADSLAAAPGTIARKTRPVSLAGSRNPVGTAVAGTRSIAVLPALTVTERAGSL
jgi:hypothetical protein